MSNHFSPPNQLTFLRIVLTPVFVSFLFSHDPFYKQLSLIVLIIAMLTDWYDGWVARRWGYISRWGQFLDPLADKVVTSAALISFIYLNVVPAWPIWLIVVRDISITWLRSYAEYKERPFETAKLAKTKTFSQFVIIYYVLLLYVARETPVIQNEYGNSIALLLDYSLIYVISVILCILTVWTGVVYIIENWVTVRQLFSPGKQIAE